MPRHPVVGEQGDQTAAGLGVVEVRKRSQVRWHGLEGDLERVGIDHAQERERRLHLLRGRPVEPVRPAALLVW